jgi:Flp pilus assembly protein TadD
MWAERGENLEQALDLIRRAVAIEPDNGAYVDSLGWVYYQRGDYDQARQHLEWAARLLPTDPTIFEHLGDLYLKLEDASRARDSYRQAVALEGDNAELVRRKLERLEQGGP